MVAQQRFEELRSKGSKKELRSKLNLAAGQQRLEERLRSKGSNNFRSALAGAQRGSK
jgi:hypothetical protein